MNTYASTRIWAKTVSKMHLIRAITNEKFVAMLDRLVQEELNRMNRSADKIAEMLQNDETKNE